MRVEAGMMLVEGSTMPVKSGMMLVEGVTMLVEGGVTMESTGKTAVNTLLLKMSPVVRFQV